MLSSFVFSLLLPAVNFSVAPHSVFLAVHAVVDDLYCPSKHTVHAVSSFVITLSMPAMNLAVVPHAAAVFLAVHALAGVR